MGNTDVAHYQGRQSIYNICILNYCKLTFEFFKNYIFEKRRQFLNRILGGGGTDAAGYKPHDVCVSKLELTIVQGCGSKIGVRANF